MKTIVVSAVNIRKGGTLTILRDCLEYLSKIAITDNYRIVAIVHNKSLADYEGIEYMELSWTIKSWGHRLWCEYITLNSISKKIGNIDLWLSLHDTTPNVIAKRRAVYCQTSFPFFKWKWQDFLFDYKIPLFTLFTKYAYKINIHKNDYLIVQQEWLRQGFSRLFKIPTHKFIVSPPKNSLASITNSPIVNTYYSFLYVATPDCHKNFELICEASKQLEKEIGRDKFTVTLTIDGKENKYSKWLYKKWGSVTSIEFHGFMNQHQLRKNYNKADCLIFPSRIETWGLPITEFAIFNKPMLLANLPYAHETASGSEKVSFFSPDNSEELKIQMKLLINSNFSFLKETAKVTYKKPYSKNWEELFSQLLQ